MTYCYCINEPQYVVQQVNYTNTWTILGCFLEEFAVLWHVINYSCMLLLLLFKLAFTGDNPIMGSGFTLTSCWLNHSCSHMIPSQTKRQEQIFCERYYAMVVGWEVHIDQCNQGVITSSKWTGTKNEEMGAEQGSYSNKNLTYMPHPTPQPHVIDML